MSLHNAIARAALDNTGSPEEARLAIKIGFRKYVNDVPPDPNRPVEAQILNAVRGNPQAYYEFRLAEIEVMFPSDDNTPPATVDSIEPTSAALGDPDLTLKVFGTDFTANHVILFNNGVEATTYVNPTELRTTVRPSSASFAGSYPVGVQSPSGVKSNTVDFELTEA